MATLRRLGKDSLFYGLGTALQKFLSLLLFPLYTRLLTPGEFGTQDVVTSVTTIVTYFLILGLDNGTARTYYDATDDQGKRAVLSSWMTFHFLVSVPVCGLAAAFADPLADLLLGDPSLGRFLSVAMLALPVSIATKITLVALRLTFRPRTFAAITCAGVVAQAAAAFLCVAVLKLGVMGVFYALFAGSGVQFALGFFVSRQSFRPILSWPMLAEMLRFGLPLVPTSLSLWAMNYANRYFLLKYETLAEVGIFGAGVRISSLIVLVITAFQIAWSPFIYSQLSDRPKMVSLLERALTYFLLVTVIGTVALSVFAREAITVLATPAYLGAAPLIPLLCAGSVAWGVAQIVGLGYGVAKASHHGLIGTVIGAVISLVANAVFVPRWGLIGAAFAMTVGNVATTVYCYHAGQRFLPARYEWRRIVGLLVVGTATVGASEGLVRALPELPLAAELSLKVVLFGGFVAGLFATGVATRAEREMLVAMIRSKLRRGKAA